MNKMTAFEQIRKSIEMTGLVRHVITDNAKYVSLRELEEQEYERFRIMYAAKPYSTTRVINRALKAIGDEAVKKRHINAAVELECLVEREWLEKAIGEDAEGPVMQGVDRYLCDGYTEMANEQSNKSRKAHEKFRVDKSSIKDFLRQAREIAVNSSDEKETVKREAQLVADIMDYNKRIAKRIWKKHGDRSVMIGRYLLSNAGVCRHIAVLTQLALQEAGIESRLQLGEIKIKKRSRGHMWNKVRTNYGVALVDAAYRDRKNQPLAVFGRDYFDCHELSMGEYDTIPENRHFFKYSTRELQ